MIRRLWERVLYGPRLAEAARDCPEIKRMLKLAFWRGFWSFYGGNRVIERRAEQARIEAFEAIRRRSETQ